MEAEILIIHLNGEEVIKNCLKSIYGDDKKANVHLLLNNTTDKSEELVRKNFPKVRITLTNKLLGFAEACNFLVKKSKAEYVIFLNNDVVVSKNWKSELLKTLKRNKNCIACQAKIKDLKDKEKFEYAGAAGGFIDKFGYPFCQGRIFGELETDKGQYNKERRIFWGCGVCLLIERKYFNMFGMFDENLFMYGEELDFCWKTNNFGKEIWYSPKSMVYHLGNFSIGSYTNDINDLRKDYWITRNHLVILLKNCSVGSLIKVLPIRMILEVIAAIRFTPVRSISFLRALISIPFYYFPKIVRKRRIIQHHRKIKDLELKNLMLNGSIVFEHFLHRKKKFSELKIK